VEAHQRKQRILVRLTFVASAAARSTLGVSCAIIISLGLLGCSAQSTGVAGPILPPGWVQPDADAQFKAAPPACGSGAAVQPLNVSGVSDRELGNDITAYLRDHCLPLARASVTTRANGDREVLLYGFVASDFGKRDAEAKTAALLANSAIGVRNAIMVRPELVASETRSTNAPAASADDAGSEANFEQANNLAQQNAVIQQYQNQNQSGLAGMLAPLLGLGFIGGSLGGGSGIFISPGGGWYPGVGPGFGYGPALGPYYPNPIGSGPYLGTFPPFP
jgi:hypothetical protein